MITKRSNIVQGMRNSAMRLSPRFQESLIARKTDFLYNEGVKT